jgi:hypothetical protein
MADRIADHEPDPDEATFRRGMGSAEEKHWTMQRIAIKAEGRAYV